MARRYFLAPSLVGLRNEFNTVFPKRDKTTDGWIGDASHAARPSDHNPDWADDGVVRATDTDKDGLPADRIVEEVLIKDPRVNYVIWNGHIWSRKYGMRKRVYTGSNKHRGHFHTSLRHGKTYENDTRSWGIAKLVAKAEPKRPNVTGIQRLLHTTPDNSWGPNTDKRMLAVRDASAFHGKKFPFGVKLTQAAVGTKQDGDWGPSSAKAHMSTVKSLQTAFNNMGYNSGKPDGIWGTKTDLAFRAIRKASKVF